MRATGEVVRGNLGKRRTPVMSCSEVSCIQYRMSASTLADGPGCELPLKHVSSISTDAVMSLQGPSKGFPEMLRYVLGCRH
jgi:hypothetical protein